MRCWTLLKQSWYKGLRWRIVWRFDHIWSCQKAGSCRCRWCNRRVWAVLILFALYYLYFIACKWAVWVWGLFEERWRKIKYNREYPASELVSVVIIRCYWSWVLCQVRNFKKVLWSKSFQCSILPRRSVGWELWHVFVFRYTQRGPFLSSAHPVLVDVFFPPCSGFTSMVRRHYGHIFDSPY